MILKLTHLILNTDTFCWIDVSDVKGSEQTGYAVNAERAFTGLVKPIKHLTAADIEKLQAWADGTLVLPPGCTHAEPSAKTGSIDPDDIDALRSRAADLGIEAPRSANRQWLAKAITSHEEENGLSPSIMQAAV